jgi:hypothetical protein
MGDGTTVVVETLVIASSALCRLKANRPDDERSRLG